MITKHKWDICCSWWSHHNVPWCLPGSPTSGFLGSRWQGNIFGIPGAWATHNFYVSVKRPIGSAMVSLSSNYMCLFSVHFDMPHITTNFHFISQTQHTFNLRVYKVLYICIYTVCRYIQMLRSPHTVLSTNTRIHTIFVRVFDRLLQF